MENLTQQLRYSLKSLFPNIWSGALSVIAILVLIWLGQKILVWGVIEARFVGTAQDCRAAAGACWSVIANRWRLMFFGLYPYSEHWRSGLACLDLIATIILSCLPYFWRFKRLAILWMVNVSLFIIIMRGGLMGLSFVPEEQWGGLTLSIFIFVSSGLIGMPLAVILALMRRSRLFLVAKGTGLLIDTVRSLPLVTILFAVAVLLPIIAPDFSGTKLVRVVAAMALFFAVYQAEIIRSGIQSLPIGQEEAAQALGLTYWQRMGRIILPQAFRRALPPTISQFAINFVEVALIIIIGMFDFLSSGNAAYGNGEWAFAYREVYLFMAFTYFVFVFSLSRYGAYLEKRITIRN